MKMADYERRSELNFINDAALEALYSAGGARAVRIEIDNIVDHASARILAGLIESHIGDLRAAAAIGKQSQSEVLRIVAETQNAEAAALELTLAAIGVSTKEKMSKFIFLDLKFDHIEARYGLFGHDEAYAKITTIEELHAFRDAHPSEIYCSSSMDFPDEYTDDQALIDLCHAIRDPDWERILGPKTS